MKRIRLVTILLALGLLVSGCGRSVQSSSTKKSSSTETQSYVPTLFFHGWGSSYHAEEHMVQVAVSAGVTHTVVRAIVSKSGKVTLHGQFKPGDLHPIVEVGFQDNKGSDYHVVGSWAKNVVVALQQTYHIKSFNMVGHSMGNMAIVFYSLENSQNKQLPKLRKQVDIAGHFNGILGMDDVANRMTLTQQGQPTKMTGTYRELLGLRRVYPKDQVDVLNIYGDKGDGSHSDGSVSNASSQSLRYLIAGRAKSYQEQKVTGPNAQHSKLHSNHRVDQLLIKFLWSK
ncbi:alpha/beta hydrolase [Lactiplantibacillus herbarum]|uniref:alpha/beta hydrolase n=1 Tax=Lactiplantibacillus herbarum TaxID=1670446 RepID=UPI00064E268E|nr:alpha/beta hydrolase [Lactiplantibacillus herbarum]